VAAALYRAMSLLFLCLVVAGSLLPLVAARDRRRTAGLVVLILLGSLLLHHLMAGHPAPLAAGLVDIDTLSQQKGPAILAALRDHLAAWQWVPEPLRPWAAGALALLLLAMLARAIVQITAEERWGLWVCLITGVSPFFLWLLEAGPAWYPPLLSALVIASGRLGQPTAPSRWEAVRLALAAGVLAGPVVGVQQALAWALGLVALALLRPGALSGRSGGVLVCLLLAHIGWSLISPLGDPSAALSAPVPADPWLISSLAGIALPVVLLLLLAGLAWVLSRGDPVLILAAAVGSLPPILAMALLAGGEGARSGPALAVYALLAVPGVVIGMAAGLAGVIGVARGKDTILLALLSMILVLLVHLRFLVLFGERV
jgi:hypothetical protein